MQPRTASPPRTPDTHPAGPPARRPGLTVVRREVELIVNARASGGRRRSWPARRPPSRDAGARVRACSDRGRGRARVRRSRRGRPPRSSWSAATGPCTRSPTSTFPQCPPAALLPAGRANNIARALGIPVDWAAAARLAVHGRPAAVDALHVATPRRTLFAVEGVSAGFHAAARHRYTGDNSADLTAGVRALAAELPRSASTSSPAHRRRAAVRGPGRAGVPLQPAVLRLRLPRRPGGRSRPTAGSRRSCSRRRRGATWCGCSPPRGTASTSGARRDLDARRARRAGTAGAAGRGRRSRWASRPPARHRTRPPRACAPSPLRRRGHERRGAAGRRVARRTASRRPVGVRDRGGRARRRPRRHHHLRPGPARADRRPARADRRGDARERRGRLRGPARDRAVERPARHARAVHPRRRRRRRRRPGRRRARDRELVRRARRSRPPRSTSASTPPAPRTARWWRSGSRPTAARPPPAPRRARCSAGRSRAPRRRRADRRLARRALRPLGDRAAAARAPTLAWQRGAGGCGRRAGGRRTVRPPSARRGAPPGGRAPRACRAGALGRLLRRAGAVHGALRQGRPRALGRRRRCRARALRPPHRRRDARRRPDPPTGSGAPSWSA